MSIHSCPENRNNTLESFSEKNLSKIKINLFCKKMERAAFSNVGLEETFFFVYSGKQTLGCIVSHEYDCFLYPFIDVAYFCNMITYVTGVRSFPSCKSLWHLYICLLMNI